MIFRVCWRATSENLLRAKFAPVRTAYPGEETGAKPIGKAGPPFLGGG
jgi:hypothetical protein